MAAPNPISNIAIQQFNTIVTDQYQSAGKLSGTSQEKHNAIGDAYKWPVEANPDMSLRGGFGGIIPQTEYDHTFITTTFDYYTLNLSLDRGAASVTDVDERSQFAKKHTTAMGRRMDEWKIDEMVTSTAASGNSIATGGTNMPVEKILEVAYEMNAKNVPMEDRFFAIGASQLKSMLNQPEITSADYVEIKGLMNGTVTRFNGFTFIIFGTSTIGGLPLSTNTRSCFAWHKDAMGLVMQEDGNVDVSYSNERRSWISVGAMIGGASALLADGVWEVKADETA